MADGQRAARGPAFPPGPSPPCAAARSVGLRASRSDFGRRRRGPLQAAAFGGVPRASLAVVRTWARRRRWADGIGRYGDTALWGAGIGEEPVSGLRRGRIIRNAALTIRQRPFDSRARIATATEVEVADGGRWRRGIGVRWIGRRRRVDLGDRRGPWDASDGKFA
jgi:hypothetical protein